MCPILTIRLRREKNYCVLQAVLRKLKQHPSMKLKFLLRNWSSVSAAAAVLLETSSRANASNPLSVPEKPKAGDGDPYEPLILKPPAVKLISEERFAGHRSHASHASHASHYSGSGAYQPPASGSPSPSLDDARPKATPTPSSPATSESPTRIEFINGAVLYGWVLTKSAAGITLRGGDGKTYKFERRQLSPQAIVDLSLPREEEPASSTSTKPETSDPLAVKRKNDELEQAIAALRAENATLRDQARGVAPAATPESTASSTSANVTYRVAGVPRNAPFLNIRGGPGENYPIVGQLAPSARGLIPGPRRVTNGWTVWQEINGGGYNGWVNAQYLAAETPTR
jgi:hypothetical protein